MDWAVVFVLGALTGFGELIARYRDAPFRATLTLPGLVYMAVNGLASIMALGIILGVGWTFGIDRPLTKTC